jgi:hypothetical protein
MVVPFSREDPRVALSRFIWNWTIGGIKGARYVVSRKYRARVRVYWETHPGTRSRGIRRMVVGAILDAVALCLIVVAIKRAR